MKNEIEFTPIPQDYEGKAKVILALAKLVKGGGGYAVSEDMVERLLFEDRPTGILKTK